MRFAPERVSRVTACLIALAPSYVRAAPGNEARSQFSPIPETGLTVLPSAMSVSLGPNAARLEAGNVNPLDSPTLEHDFVLKNQGAVPLTIAQVGTSCDCVSVRLPPSAGAITLSPGQEITAHVSIAITVRHSGPFTNSVYVPIDGHPGYAALLQIEGTVTSPITISPATLEFGKLYTGQPRALTVKITADSRLAPGGLPFKLIASDPSVTVGRFPQVAQRGDATALTYTVTQHAGKPGVVTGILTLEPAVRIIPQGSHVAPDTIRDILDSISIPFSATILRKTR